MNKHTPILVGIGQYLAPVPDDLNQAASHADIAGRAARLALEDAGVSGEFVDWLACVRTFSDSSPAYACPFGGPDKFPRAVAARIEATPQTAIYDVIGGQSPQTLVAEAWQALQSGEARFAVIAGGEALANMRAAQRAGIGLDWSENHNGAWKDRGLFSGPMIVSQTELAHGLMDAMAYYGFIETARRIKAGRSVEDHRAYMAELIAPMSDVAVQNPKAMFQQSYSAEEIATPSAANRPLISPFLKNMVAKDRVNQGAAVVMTTIAQAEAQNIPREQWVFLRGHAEAQEALMLDRADLSRSVAMDLVIEGALDAAKVAPSDIDHADIYSCFPCVVDRRAAPGSLGLAHGNGGWMSKQAIGIYSTEWAAGEVFADKDKLAKAVAAQSAPGQTSTPSGEATLESYIVQHKGGGPVSAVLIGQLEDGTRFYAKLQDADEALLTAMAEGKLDGAKLKVESGLPSNKAWLI